MSDGAQEQQEQEGNTPAPEGAEANLTEQEQASLKVAREGLPETNPNAKPDNRPQRPEGIPEKFWDAEKGEVRVDALAKSYTELEKGAAAPADSEGDPNDAEGDDDDVDTKGGKISKKEKVAEGEAEENPLTGLIGSAAEEFQTNGEFTEETAENLEKAGIPKQMQSIYLEGLKAMQAQQEAAVTGYVGGEDEYKAMARWAGQHLSDEELDAFNASLDNPMLTENAVRGLYARFKAAKPSEGKKVAPASNTVSQGGDIFSSRKELTDAMSDPRYHSDAAYQRSVVEKLARTRKAGGFS